MKLIFVRHGDPLRESFSISQKGINESILLGELLTNLNIDGFYSGTTDRATETAEIISARSRNKKIIKLGWLNEFKHEIELPDGQKQFPWELSSDLWCTSQMLDREKCMMSNMFKSGEIKKYAYELWENIDMFLTKKGYIRTGNVYNVIRGNSECHVFVSHFATISVLLSHLLNIPLPIMLNGFWMAPSSYTTLVTEEIEKGKAIFRCINYGETKHLHLHNDLMSNYGLQIEYRD